MCAWLIVATVSSAADELPSMTTPSRLYWIWSDQPDAKAETVMFEKVFALDRRSLVIRRSASGIYPPRDFSDA